MDSEGVKAGKPEEPKGRKVLLSPIGKFKREPNRNEPCPCGSGKKWKRCHGILIAQRKQEALS